MSLDHIGVFKTGCDHCLFGLNCRGWTLADEQLYLIHKMFVHPVYKFFLSSYICHSTIDPQKVVFLFIHISIWPEIISNFPFDCIFFFEWSPNIYILNLKLPKQLIANLNKKGTRNHGSVPLGNILPNFHTYNLTNKFTKEICKFVGEKEFSPMFKWEVRMLQRFSLNEYFRKSVVFF